MQLTIIMKNNIKNKFIALFALCLVFCGTALFLLVSCERTPTTQSPIPKQSVYNRVLSSGTIRAGYITYAPVAIKDPNTGKLSGIFVDALEEIGRRLNLKVEWVEEVGYGNMFEGLQADRYDILGSGLWRNATRGKAAYFSEPLFFNAIRVWVRADEKRFTDLQSLNSPDVRIAVQDAAIEDIIAKSDFPKAQRVSIPQLDQWSENLMNITSGKADATFAELGVITPFLKQNPGTLKELNVGRPIRVFASSFAFKMGDNEFKSMIDSAVEEIINDGTMDKILQKYETAPGEQLRTAPSYAFPQ